ncbi:hypothetical protein [Arenimonas daejeonensis]|uniref:hypothetical protein n=1 Tax=Arenimonas daejeonensis TaxID=370777 RepID=UPI0011BF64A0|nr:hypothetical protein [Arenimonas daejeonensis]
MVTSRCVRTFLLVSGALFAPDGHAGEAQATGEGHVAGPHWSGLPIWGAEAEARGFVLPAPFGIAITAYSAEQPVNIEDLRLGRNGAPPVSVSNVLQIDRVDTTQQNVSAKFDVLVLPFLDVYGLAGYTRGTTRGVIEVPGDSLPGFIVPRQLQLDAEFSGPTYGAGVTLQGGTPVGEDPDLMAIVVLDWNRTRTDLEFENDALIAETNPEATVFSARLGLHGTLGSKMTGAVWIGAMHQTIQQTVAGGVSDTDLQFVVQQSPTRPWNTLLGALLELGDDGGYVLVEGGLGARKSLLLSAVYRF